MIELHFPVLGTALSADHGYALYSALSRIVPDLHKPNAGVLVGPIAGEYVGKRELRLDHRRSRLRLRLLPDHIGFVLPLAGRSLELGHHRVRLGVPQVRTLIPATVLSARMVTIKRSDRQDANGTKGYMEPAAFLEAVRQELTRRGIGGKAEFPLITVGDRAGQPRRRVLRIKEQKIIGFSVHVTDLNADESVRLQEAGLGGRRKMGCGFFVAMKETRP